MKLQATSSGLSAAQWVGLSFAAAAALAIAVLTAAGTGEHGTSMALRATARLAFLPFWLAYSGAALVSLFGAALQPVQRHARGLGLAFAAMEVVHLILVCWLCLIGHTPSMGTFLVFGTAIVFVFLLTLFSIKSLRSLLGVRGWWMLRVIGTNYVAFAFAKDFLRSPLFGGLGHAVLYWPFAALCIVGPGLRLVAATQHRAQRLKAAGYLTG